MSSFDPQKCLQPFRQAGQRTGQGGKCTRRDVVNLHNVSLTLFAICSLVQMSSRQKVEASLRQLERERALLTHQSAENLRKVEIESDRKRSLENECKRWRNITSKHGALEPGSCLIKCYVCCFDSLICLYLLTSEQLEGPAGGS